MTKLLKKSLAVVLSVALCLSVMLCGFVASAETAPTITPVVPESVKAGEAVAIDVTVADFDAVAGAEFTVDLGGLTYVSLADGLVAVADYTNVVDNTVKFVCEDLDAVTDGVLFTINTTVAKDAADNTAYTVAIVDGLYCEASDGEPEVAVTAVEGVVTVAPAVVDPSVAINVSPAEGYIGDEIAIEVVAANFDKVAGAQFVVDLGGLEYVSVASDAIEDITEYINPVDGGVKFVNEKVADGLVDIEAADGVLFTITAKIVDEADAEIAIVDSKFCEGGEGEPVIENVILAGATVASLGNKGPVEDATLATALVNTQLQIGSTVGLYYTFNLPTATYDYDNVVISVDKEELDAAYNKTGSVVNTLIDFNSPEYDGVYAAYGVHAFAYFGVALYEMQLEVTPTITLYKDGNAVSYYTYESTTLTAVAEKFYNEKTDIVDKSIAVDFLNMGTEAQKAFGAAGNSLSDLALPNANVDQSYATECTLTDTSVTADEGITARLQLLSAPSFWFTFANTAYNNPADMTFTATYYSKASDATISRTINGADMTGNEGIYAQYGVYSFGFDMLALYDSNKEVTFTVEAADGTTWTYVRTLDSFIAEILANPEAENYDVYAAVAAFGQATRNKWPSYS